MSRHRGINTLFNDLFLEEPSTVCVAEKKQKGRSPDLISRRNECMLDRYFFYLIRRPNYVVLLETISNEFFLSMVTIPDIVDENYDYITDLRKQFADNPEKVKKVFAGKWPHLVW
jgi:hypothetical protein